MMDLMKAMNDPATAQAMAQAPTMLADLLDTLHQIRDAAILQSRISAWQNSVDKAAIGVTFDQIMTGHLPLASLPSPTPTIDATDVWLNSLPDDSK